MRPIRDTPEAVSLVESLFNSLGSELIYYLLIEQLSKKKK